MTLSARRWTRLDVMLRVSDELNSLEQFVLRRQGENLTPKKKVRTEGSAHGWLRHCSSPVCSDYAQISADRLLCLLCTIREI